MTRFDRIRSSRTITVLAWLAVLSVAAWTLIRVCGLERGYPAAALIAFTPYVIPAGLVLALLLIALRRRGLAAVACVCVLVLALVLLPRTRSDDPPDPRPQGPELRMIGINLLLGRADLSQIDQLAADYDADVVDFSELTPEAAAAIEDSPLGARMPYSALDPHDGSAGTGLISRYPLRQLSAPGTEGNDLPSVIADIELPGGVSAQLYAVHPFPPTGPYATGQIGRYLDAIPPAPGAGPPRILIGDFNSTLDDVRLRDLIDTGYIDVADARGEGLTPTWPRRLFPPPPVSIDHVVADDRVEALDFGTAEIEGSDHWAIKAALRLPSAEQAGG